MYLIKKQIIDWIIKLKDKLSRKNRYKYPYILGQYTESDYCRITLCDNDIPSSLDIFRLRLDDLNKLSIVIRSKGKLDMSNDSHKEAMSLEGSINTLNKVINKIHSVVIRE